MTLPLITSAYEAEHICMTSNRCTEAALRAFGIEGKIPQTGSGCLLHLDNAGYKVKLLPVYKVKMSIFRHNFMDVKKNYLITTERHAMALIAGILVDTAQRGWDQRKILFVWEVSE